jgi:hypothetical protein
VVANVRSSSIASALSWVVALVGLAVPMVGGNFVGWPIVVGWLVVLLSLWLTRPLKRADRPTRFAGGVGAVVGLVVLIPLGGFYLLPAAITWLALVYLESSRDIPAH